MGHAAPRYAPARLGAPLQSPSVTTTEPTRMAAVSFGRLGHAAPRYAPARLGAPLQSPSVTTTEPTRMAAVSWSGQSARRFMSATSARERNLPRRARSTRDPGRPRVPGWSGQSARRFMSATSARERNLPRRARSTRDPGRRPVRASTRCGSGCWPIPRRSGYLTGAYDARLRGVIAGLTSEGVDALRVGVLADPPPVRLSDRRLRRPTSGWLLVWTALRQRREQGDGRPRS